SYFSFEDERLGQGRQNATAFLREHPDVTQSILQRIQTQLGDDQIASARLLPVAESADQEKAAKKKAAVAAAAGEEAVVEEAAAEEAVVEETVVEEAAVEA